MACKNSLGNNAIDSTSDALKVYCKSNQLLYLFTHAATVQLMYMQNNLKKPKGLMVCIAIMQLMDLIMKIKYLTSKGPGPKLNNLLDDLDLYAILQFMAC